MFEFALERTVGAARAGTLPLPHGTVRTPAFMPVGTHGVVRGLSAADVRRTGAQIILGNTYHLHIRPGEDVVRAMGGLHRFTTWDRPMLTDSGGFQVFSLEGLRRIAEDGVTFQSHVDGTTRMLTPERAMEIVAQVTRLPRDVVQVAYKETVRMLSGLPDEQVETLILQLKINKEFGFLKSDLWDNPDRIRREFFFRS